MCFLIGVCQPAWFLFNLNIFRVGWKRKRNNPLISELLFHFAVVNGISSNTCRCSCFKTEHFDSQFFQRICKIIGSLESVRTCVVAYIAVDTSCFQVGSCTENDCLTIINSTWISFYAFNLSIFNQKLCYFTLLNSKVRSIFQCLSHLIAVCLFIRLCTQRMNRRSFGAVEHFWLNKCFINILSHFTAKSIQFSYQMSLGTATYIWITWH